MRGRQAESLLYSPRIVLPTLRHYAKKERANEQKQLDEVKVGCLDPGILLPFGAASLWELGLAVGIDRSFDFGFCATDVVERIPKDRIDAAWVCSTT
jgi:hypothetical protein